MSPSRPGMAGAAGLLVAGSVAAVVDALARDGVRAGPWQAEALPAGVVLVALFLLGTLVPRRPFLPPRRSLPALFLVLLALTAVQVWRSAPAPRAPALTARLRSAGIADRYEKLTLHALRTPARMSETLGAAPDRDLEIAGFLTIPEGGTYTFEAECGGSCTLAIDGRVLLSGQGHQRVAAPFVAGVRPVRFTLRPHARRPYARFDWNRPAFFERARLGDAVTSTPEAADLVQRERQALLRTLLHWLLAAAAVVIVIDLAAAARGVVPAVPGAARHWLSVPAHRVGTIAGGASLVFIAGLHAWIAPRALPGGYLHPWTSEFMMQTVSVADLRDEPLRSLLFNHIQPPLFDALRAALVAANPMSGDDPLALLTAVDHGLYACWAVAYALGAALVATWVARLAGVTVGALAAAFYALHPATLFYATYLDSTLVSALGVSWVIYELWRFRPGAEGSPARFGAAVIVLFLTRSVVQWPFVAVLLVALLLRGCASRRAMRTMAPLVLVMGLFLAKQYLLFGLSITSSFGPDSFCKGLWEYCPGAVPVDVPTLPPPTAASALRRVAKINDEYNYNQLAALRRSFSQMEEYKAFLREIPPVEIARRWSRNLWKWLLPSSRHSAHVLVDALPWREVFDRLMSGFVLIALVLGAGAIWLVSSRRNRRAVWAGLALGLPVLYVAAVSIAFERNENMRYKFFVEPVLIVLLVSQAAVAARAMRR